MKTLLIALLAIFSISPVYADGGHGGGWGHGGGGWGRGGWGGDWIFPALVGGAILYDVTRPQTVYVQPSPVYVQPAPVYAPSYGTSVAPQASSYWYYCAASNAYYPYVSSCPSGWQTVLATPPAPVAAMPSPPVAVAPSAPGSPQAQK